MIKWVVELGQFNLNYKQQTTIKGQALVVLISEFSYQPERGQTPQAIESTDLATTMEKRLEKLLTWTLYVDGSLNEKGVGVGLILISLKGTCIQGPSGSILRL